MNTLTESASTDMPPHGSLPVRLLIRHEMLSLLTLGEFRAWLQSHQPHAECGTPTSAQHCPLAKYLNDTHPGYNHQVGLKAALAYPKPYIVQNVPAPLPDWAKVFVTHIDALKQTFTYSDKQYVLPFLTISYKKALEVLDEVEASLA